MMTISSEVIVITWKHNDTWIHDFANKHYRQLVDGSLQYTAFLYSDQGQHQCSAVLYDDSNKKIGQIFSRVAATRIACMFYFTIRFRPRFAFLCRSFLIKV